MFLVVASRFELGNLVSPSPSVCLRIICLTLYLSDSTSAENSYSLQDESTVYPKDLLLNAHTLEQEAAFWLFWPTVPFTAICLGWFPPGPPSVPSEESSLGLSPGNMVRLEPG